MDRTDEDLLNNELRNCIEKLLKEQAINNHTMDISAGTIAGDNYMGTIAKVKVTGEDKNGKSKTLNFIVKSAPRNEALRALTIVQSTYAREICIYDKILPTFTQFQEERTILQPFKSFAKYYGSTLKDVNEGIIMEDMKALGFDLCDRKKPLDYNHVMLVLREYGRFHALSYALRDQQPELFKQLADYIPELFVEELVEDFRKLTRETVARALKSLDPIKDKVAYNKVNRFKNNVIDLLMEVTRSVSIEKYGVINHGDCWTNNILFAYEDSANPNSPSQVCFLDWQLSRIGSPVFDLSYFIFACTSRKLREEHYADMIQEYYKSLSSFLRELGSDPEKMLPFEVLQEHLQKFSMYGLYWATSVLYLMNSESEEVPDMDKAKNVEDVEKGFLFNSKNEEICREKIRAVLLDFVNLGYDI